MATLVPQDHPALHTIAEEVPVDEIDSPRIKKVLKDMRTALHDYNVEGFTAVAIAAPQIGVSLRIFLVEDMSTDESDEKRVPTITAINPVLVKYSKKKQVVGEGCLSVPDSYGAVERTCQVTLRAYDASGAEFERGAGGLLAQIFQHEVDHLDGTLYTDRAEKLWSKDEFDSLKLKEAELE